MFRLGSSGTAALAMTTLELDIYDDQVCCCYQSYFIHLIHKMKLLLLFFISLVSKVAMGFNSTQ